MKYRRLSADELKELERDFIDFLASNQVTAQDWEKLKETDTEKVEKLIEMFSDIVFDRVLKKVEYLEYRTHNDIKTFHCQKDKIHMLGLFAEGNSDLDFTKAEDPSTMMEKLRNSNANLKVYQAEKQYKIPRDQELFKMMEGGALISRDGAMYKTLAALIKPNES